MRYADAPGGNTDTPVLSDEALMERFVAGDRDALGELFTRHRSALVAYAMRELGDRQHAEDVCTDVFMTIVRKAAQFDLTRAFRPWMYTIAHHKIIDAQRKKNRHREMLESDVPLHEYPDPEFVTGIDGLAQAREEDSATRLGRHEDAAKIRSVLARLPAKQRECVMLTYFRGLKYREVADALELPMGTVKSRLHAALVAMHECIQSA